MDDIDDILAVMEESNELARRLEALNRRLGDVGSPELSDIGGTVTMFLSPGTGNVSPALDGYRRATAP